MVERSFSRMTGVSQSSGRDFRFRRTAG
jgi:hypothetical protein